MLWAQECCDGDFTMKRDGGSKPMLALQKYQRRLSGFELSRSTWHQRKRNLSRTYSKDGI